MNLYRAPCGALPLFVFCCISLLFFQFCCPMGKRKNFTSARLVNCLLQNGQQQKRGKKRTTKKKIEKLFPIEFCVGLQIIRYESLWACGFWFWDCGWGLWLEGSFVFVLMLMLMLCRSTPLGKMQLFQMKLFSLTQRNVAGHCELFDGFLQISFLNQIYCKFH